jgi:hypothetical protein
MTIRNGEMSRPYGEEAGSLVSLSALQRDLDRAYEHEAAVERQVSDIYLRLTEARARGESAVADALQPELSLGESRLRSSREDIEAIREALRNTTMP